MPVWEGRHRSPLFAPPSLRRSQVSPEPPKAFSGRWCAAGTGLIRCCNPNGKSSREKIKGYTQKEHRGFHSGKYKIFLAGTPFLVLPGEKHQNYWGCCKKCLFFFTPNSSKAEDCSNATKNQKGIYGDLPHEEGSRSEDSHTEGGRPLGNHRRGSGYCLPYPCWLSPETGKLTNGSQHKRSERFPPTSSPIMN